MAECSFIEIAANSIRAGILQGRGKSAKLVAYHEENILVSEEELPKVLSSVFEGLAARIKLAGKSTVVAISSKYLIYRVADFPFSDKKRVVKTLPFQIEEHLPLPIDEVLVDSFEVSNGGSSSKWFACCLPKKLMQAIIEACHNCKIEPMYVSPTFTGIPSIVDEKDTSLIIDIGKETTDLLIVKDKKVKYCRTLRLAGKTITASLAAALSVNEDVAEETKLSSKGFEDTDSAFRDIIQAEARRFVREIRMTLSTIPEELTPKNIKLMGGGSLMNGFDKYLNEKLNLDVSVIKMEDTLQTGSLLEKTASQGLLPASGLAASVNANVPLCVNFRREEFAYHGVFDSIAWSLAFLLLLITGILGVFSYHFMGIQKQYRDSMSSAEKKLADIWVKAMPEEARAPNSISKYPAFIEDWTEKLTEGSSAKDRFYETSVLEDIKKVRDFFRKERLKSETISMDANKSSFKIVINVTEEEASKVNRAITTARAYYRVDQTSESKKGDIRRYTLTFTKKEDR